MYCTQCNTNWARLWSYDEDDNGYEFCPDCYTDKYLVEKKEDEPAYICCKFTGDHIDAKTGKKRDKPHYEPPPFTGWPKWRFRKIPARNL